MSIEPIRSEEAADDGEPDERAPTLTAPDPRPAGAWWAWRPLHGGAGTSTLSRAVPGGIVLADDPSEHGWPTLPVIAVTRSHAGGLLAAQRFAAEIAVTPRVRLLGLVIIADTPGRLPRSLETIIRLINGGYPHVWRAAWVEGWRRGEPVTPRSIPTSYRTLLDDLMARTGMRPPPDPVADQAAEPPDSTDRTADTDSTDVTEEDA